MGFQVCDVARMADFYKRVMGFTVTGCSELDTPHGRLYLVFLSRDPEEHHQIVLASGRPSDIPYNIVNQISFRVPDLAWLRSLHQTLQHEKDVTEIHNEGAPPAQAAHHANHANLAMRCPT